MKLSAALGFCQKKNAALRRSLYIYMSATMTTTDRPAEASGTFVIGDIPVHRLGFGAMQLTGDGVWGEPEDHDEAIAVLRRTVELGINLIDTADSYGPEVSERLIAEALHPYPENLLIATKAGFQRPGPNRWVETVAQSICDPRSKAVFAGSGSSESICYNCTGSIQKFRWQIKSAHWSISSARARFAISDCLRSA
jgi:hypothetical protein